MKPILLCDNKCMFMVWWSFFCLVVLLCVLYILLRPMVRGAIYFPTTAENVERITTFLNDMHVKKVADIGSGDGRILIALAEKGMEAHGYEINPLLVFRARRAIRARGLEDRAHVYWKDLWRANLSGFDAVVVYGFPNIMPSLGKKLQKELVPGAKVASNVFKFPDWAPLKKEHQIYFYEMPPVPDAPSPSVSARPPRQAGQ
jgi:hypothetical protein